MGCDDDLDLCGGKVVDDVCDLLRGHEDTIQSNLALLVASLCNVEAKRMLSDCNVLSVAQARWLYWYAARYMTGETYGRIAERTGRQYGRRFTMQGVAIGVAKMSQMVDTEAIWKRRWSTIRRIIKMQEGDDGEKVDNTVVIQVPKGLKGKVNIEIKEK